MAELYTRAALAARYAVWKMAEMRYNPWSAGHSYLGDTHG